MSTIRISPSFGYLLCLVIPMLAILAGFTSLQKVSAETFTVTKLTDSNDGVCDSDCSLREAIIAANADPGADSITLQSGTYTLSLAGTGEDAAATGDLDILEPLTITGQGANITIIDGQDNDRVFDILASVEVNINGLTIRNGSVTDNGGGVRCSNGGTLTFEDIDLESNTAENEGGGLHSYQCNVILNSSYVILNTAYQGAGLFVLEGTDLQVIDTMIMFNTSEETGGGIFSLSSEASLTDTWLISNNATSGSGGGIYQAGTGAIFSLVNSKVADNYAGGEGGGVFLAVGSSGYIENSTISSNRANRYGAGLNTRIPTTVLHSTIAGNIADYDSDDDGGGGGVFLYQSSAVLSIENTIIADNSDYNITPFPDCLAISGSVTSLGYNLVEDTGNCTFSGTGDLLSQDPLLGALQDNGGFTWTHALLPGSPAIDAGNPSFTVPPDFDQRGDGFPRVINGRIDIGAFESWRAVFLPIVLKH